MIPAAFIEQDTNFFPYMTVKETLDFRVELKLGRTVNKNDRDDIVKELMALLSLSKSANTIVGNTKVRGVSGGERKRLSIACEMIDSPPVIFLGVFFTSSIYRNCIFSISPWFPNFVSRPTFNLINCV